MGRNISIGAVDVLLVCSPGGHALQLSLLREAWAEYEAVWVTLEAEDTRSLLENEVVVYAHGPTTRNVPNLFRNLSLAWRLLRVARPQVVVTTGAGIAVPFAWIGRLFGARIVYIESLTRIESASLSGRLIAPVTDRLYVQWPELRPLSAPGPLRRDGGWEGMIVVTVGSNGAPFDRLLREVDGIEATEDMLVQHGPSQIRPKNARCVPFLHFAELEAAVRSARLVVTHAGVGSVLLALMNGKHPIVVPREARFGEVVDDHQVHFAERLAQDRLVTLVRDPRDLARTVDENSHERRAAAPSETRALRTELAGYLRSAISSGRQS